MYIIYTYMYVYMYIHTYICIYTVSPRPKSTVLLTTVKKTSVRNAKCVPGLIVRCGLDYVYMAPFCRLLATIQVWKGWNEGQYATLHERQFQKNS